MEKCWSIKSKCSALLPSIPLSGYTAHAKMISNLKKKIQTLTLKSHLGEDKLCLKTNPCHPGNNETPLKDRKHTSHSHLWPPHSEWELNLPHFWRVCSRAAWHLLLQKEMGPVWWLTVIWWTECLRATEWKPQRADRKNVQEQRSVSRRTQWLENDFAGPLLSHKD